MEFLKVESLESAADKLWQIESAEKMQNFISNLYKVDSIQKKGSVLNPKELDMYSDVDMEIFLSDNTAIDIKDFLGAVAKNFSDVFGYEVIAHSRKDAIRMCLVNGQRFDLIFRYPSDKEVRHEENSATQKIDELKNQFWFMASMVLVKLGRKDNLIAAQLALELCQLIIVIQMLARDEKKGTNIHRFGDDEAVPIFNALAGASFDISSVLFTAADMLDKEKSDILNSFWK